MGIDLNYFKKVLEEEKARVEAELNAIAKRRVIDHHENWETIKPEMNIMTADKSEMADVSEEIENRMGMEGELEERLNEVKAALERIKKGTYGICEVGGEPINQKRLKANPMARTCIKHTKEK